MYEELELWKECGFQYKKKAKENVSKLTPLEYEYLLDELCTKEMGSKEFDKELDKLAKRL